MSESERNLFQPIEALQQILLAEDAFGVAELIQSDQGLSQEPSAREPFPLLVSSTCSVEGEGPSDASVMFLWDTPLQQDDPAVELLDRMIKGMKLDRSTVFVGHAAQYRAPVGNPLEVAYLLPKAICVLGVGAATVVLGNNKPLKDLRDSTWEMGETGIPVIVTHHPAELLEDDQLKRATWGDLKRVLALLTDA